jgi:hypothetical protein
MCAICGCGKKKGQAGYGKGKKSAAKGLSPKQKKIAGKAGDPKKIDAADLAALRNKKKK